MPYLPAGAIHRPIEAGLGVGEVTGELNMLIQKLIAVSSPMLETAGFKVDTDGIITTMAGNGGGRFSGDGGLATAASLSSPQGVALAGL